MPSMMTGNISRRMTVSMLLRRIWVCIPTYLIMRLPLEVYFRSLVVCRALFLWYLEHRLFAEVEHLCEDV